jgi:hypothetical protein
MDKLREILEDVFEKGYQRSFERSWFSADRAERKHRIKYVVLLSAELEKIRSQNIHATALGEGAIEQLIEGNYDEMMRYREDFIFDGEEYCEKYASLWERFRQLLEEAYVRRPGQSGRMLQ